MSTDQTLQSLYCPPEASAEGSARIDSSFQAVLILTASFLSTKHQETAAHLGYVRTNTFSFENA